MRGYETNKNSKHIKAKRKERAYIRILTSWEHEAKLFQRNLQRAVSFLTYIQLRRISYTLGNLGLLILT